jgi:hypothetical protein
VQEKEKEIKKSTLLVDLWLSSVDIFKKYTVAIMLIFGLAFLFGGMLLRQNSNTSLEFIGELFISGGTAIIGAGVFAAIMKSWQFTTLFQKHILTVFTDPNSLNDIINISERWAVLTNSRLQGVLPDFFKSATNKLQEQFFDEELQYHFSDYLHEYDISVGESSKVVVDNIFQANVIKNPSCTQIEFKQSFKSISSDGGVELLQLEVNGKPIDNAQDHFKEDKDEPGRFWLTIDVTNLDGQTFRINRVVRYNQDLRQEPFIHGVISRYIRGGAVKAKISDGYKLYFQQFGIGANTDFASVGYDGYHSWTLAHFGDLLLPGQGYMIVITPDTA